MAIEVKVKKWGNSMGVIIPSEVIEASNLRENDSICLTIVKKANFSDVFGMIKDRKMSGQAFKDMVRAGWESEEDKKRWKS